MKENKLISELYRIHSLIRMINEDVNLETKNELSDFVNQYMDNNDCKQIHDHIDQFDKEGKIILTDREKKDFEYLKKQADGENTFGVKLRDAGLFCGTAKKTIKNEFKKLLDTNPDPIHKVLCWFNENKYNKNNVMKSCSSLKKIQIQASSQQKPSVSTNKPQPTKPTNIPQPAVAASKAPTIEPKEIPREEEAAANIASLASETAKQTLSYDTCVSLFSNVINYYESGRGSLPPDDMLKKDNPKANGLKDTLQACLWQHNFGIGQGAVKIKKLYNLTGKGKQK